MTVIDALRSLADGEEEVARRSVFRALKRDPHDLTAWALAAAVVDDEIERGKCIERIARIEELRADYAEPPDGYVPLESAVAAVNRNRFPESVRALTLHEPLVLVREPDNFSDTNAIRVERLNHQMCGYIPRPLAALLAPEIDGGTIARPSAYVTELTTSFFDGTLSLRVAIPLPPDLRARLRDATLAEEERRLAYTIERSEHYAYILLNCTEQRFQLIRSKLREQGFESQRVGMSDRPTRSGRTYRWFIRVEPDSGWDEAAIERFFEEQFETLSDTEIARQAAEEERRLRANLAILEEGEDRLQREVHAARDRLEQVQAELALALEEAEYEADLAQSYADDVDEKQDEISRLRNQMDNLENELQTNRLEQLDQQRQLEILTTAEEEVAPESVGLARVLQDLFPNVLWLRDSLTVLTERYTDPGRALGQIHTIACRPHEIATTLKPKRLRGPREWWELHTSTGRANDGRLYYRLDPDATRLLVSFKAHQESDVGWLRRQ